jgi:alpha-1,6-mannosyltransferase
VSGLSGRARARGIVGALGVVSVVGYGVGLPRLVADTAHPHLAYIGLFASLFVLYLLATSVVLRRPDDRVVLGLVLAFGLFFRVSVLASPVVLSSDVYRYLWDGRVQWAGISPYRYPPAAAELEALRDETIYASINRPTKPTVYPPGAQVAFAFVAGVAPDSIPAWRAFLLASDVVTVALLLALLRRAGVTPAAAIVYAWSPLVVFEGVQAGHVDLAMLPLVLAALAWRQRGSSVRAGIALGGAVLLKLYPLVLLAAWWRPRDWRLPAAVAATVVLGYLPYAAGVGLGALGFLPEYFGSAEDHNVGLRALVTYPLGLSGEPGRAVAMALLFGVMAVVLVGIGRANGGEASGMLRAGALAVATYLLLVPTSMHPWYAVWIIPFLCFYRWPAWLYFTGGVTLSYMSYVVEPAPIPWWAWLAEYGPLYALLLWAGWRALRQRVPVAIAPRTT